MVKLLFEEKRKARNQTTRLRECPALKRMAGLIGRSSPSKIRVLGLQPCPVRPLNVPALRSPREENVSSGDLPGRTASRKRTYSSARAKQSRRSSRRSQVITAQQPPAAMPAPATPDSGERRNPVPLAEPAIQWRPISSLRISNKEAHRWRPIGIISPPWGKPDPPGLRPQGAIARRWRGHCGRARLNSYLFLSFAVDPLGSAELISSIGDQCEPVLSLL